MTEQSITFPSLPTFVIVRGRSHPEVKRTPYEALSFKELRPNAATQRLIDKEVLQT